MYPTIFPGEAIDTIDSYSIECGKLIVNESESLDLDCVSENYIPFPSCDVECNITLSLSNIGDCNDSDQAPYTFTIFHENQGIDGFSVYLGNESEPIYIDVYNDTDSTQFTLYLESTGSNIALDLIDNEFNECQSSLIFSTQNCVCNITGIYNQIQSCDISDSVLYVLVLDHQNEGQNGFNIFIDGILLNGSPFVYEENNTEINFFLLGDDKDHEIKVVDLAKDYCEHKVIIRTPDCMCQLTSELEFQNCELGEANYILSIIEKNGNQEGFDIYIDGILVNPVPISYNGNGTTMVDVKMPGDDQMHELLVVDHSENSCQTLIETNTPLCECDIYRDLTISECNNEYVDVYIVLDLDSIQNLGFTTYIDGVITQPFAVSFSVDSVYLTFKMIGDGMSHNFAADNSNCSISAVFTLPDCICYISINDVLVGSCEVGDSIPITISIDYKNVNDDILSLIINDNQLNIISIPILQSMGSVDYSFSVAGNGETYSVLIRNPNDDLCFDEYNFSTPNCECSLSFSADLIEACDVSLEEIYQINLLEYPAGIFVNVILDGELLLEDPILIEDFVSSPFSFPLDGDGEEHILLITDVNSNQCSSTFIISTSVCPCLFSVDAYIIGECNPNGEYQIQVEASNGIVGNSYKIYIDDHEIEFSVYDATSNIHVFYLPADGNFHTIKIEDLSTECISSTNIELPNCTCNIDLTNSLLVSCDASSTETWQLNVTSNDSILKMFDVFIDEVYIGSYNHEIPSTEVTFEAEGDAQIHSLRVVNSENETCNQSISFQSSDCICKLDASISLSSGCLDGEVSISGEIAHFYTEGAMFDIFIDETYIESYLFQASGITQFNTSFLGDGQMHTIVFVDSEKGDCLFETSVQSPLCDEESGCELSFIAFSDFDCSLDETTGTIQFESSNSGESQYRVDINGNEKEGSPFDYHPSGINTISIVSSDCNSVKIEISDINDFDCKIDTTIIPKFEIRPFIYYPNPIFNQNKLILENIDSSDLDRLLSFKMYNTLGQLIFKTEIIGSNKMSIDLSDLQFVEGVYYFGLGSKNLYNGKLFIM